MAYLRFKALEILNARKPIPAQLPSNGVSDFFNENVFHMEQMRATHSPAVVSKVSESISKWENIDETTEDPVNIAVKSCAISKGATHVTHCFQPRTGGTAEKHDSFFD